MKETEDFYDEILDDELELEENSDEFDDEDEDDDPLQVRTAVMSKNEMLALLSLRITSDGGGLIVRVDPRQPVPAAKTYEDPEQAAEWFHRSLATSKRNGWTIVYLGEPLVG